jgi:hypothetical protein
VSLSVRLVLAVAAGAAVAGSIWSLGCALRPSERRLRSSRRPLVGQRTLAAAIGVAALVLLLTRWPVAAAASAVLVASWRVLFAARDATGARRRLEAIAKWLEDLRDLQAGSNLDLIEALAQSASRAPKEIEPALANLAARMSHHVPLADSLVDLADDLDHPVADTAVATMAFAAGHASGSELGATFAQLAETARDELAARDRIDRMRVNFERSMRRMLAVLAVLLVYLVVVSPEVLEPYRSVAGQAWMVVPIVIWGTSLVWLRHLARYERSGRFVSHDRITEAAP